MASQLKPTRNFSANTRDTDKFDDGHQRQRRQQQRSGGGGAMQLRPTSCAVNIDSPLLHCYYHDIASNANMSEPSTPFFIFNRWKSFRSNCRLIDPWRHNKQLFNHLKALIVKFHQTKRRKSLGIFRTGKIGNMFFFVVLYYRYLLQWRTMQYCKLASWMQTHRTLVRRSTTFTPYRSPRELLLPCSYGDATLNPVLSFTFNLDVNCQPTHNVIQLKLNNNSLILM